MIPIQKMHFTTSKDAVGDTVVKGTLTFTFETTVNKHEAKPKVIEYAKGMIREKCWRDAYGDINKPLAELEMIALRELQGGSLNYAQDAVKKLRALLDSQNVDSAKPSR